MSIFPLTIFYSDQDNTFYTYLQDMYSRLIPLANGKIYPDRDILKEITRYTVINISNRFTAHPKPTEWIPTEVFNVGYPTNDDLYWIADNITANYHRYLPSMIGRVGQKVRVNNLMNYSFISNTIVIGRNESEGIKEYSFRKSDSAFSKTIILRVKIIGE